MPPLGFVGSLPTGAGSVLTAGGAGGLTGPAAQVVAAGLNGFWGQLKVWAGNRVPALQNGRIIGTDFLGASGNEFLFSGAAPPVFDPNYTGGVLQIPSVAGFGDVDLGATAIKRLIGSARGEPWAAKVLVRHGSPTFSGATTVQPILVQSSTESIYILSIPGTSTTVYQFSLFSGGTDHITSCGAVGTLGSATCPTGGLVTSTVGLWFDGVNLGVEFNDTPAFAPLFGAQLNFMATGPVGLSSACSDLNFGFRIDAMALVTM